MKAFRIFLFTVSGVMFLVGSAELLSSCGHTPLFKLKIHTYAGNSEAGGISRLQDKETISCSDPLIDQFVCMSYSDLKHILMKMNRCKKWADEDDDD